MDKDEGSYIPLATLKGLKPRTSTKGDDGFDDILDEVSSISSHNTKDSMNEVRQAEVNTSLSLKSKSSRCESNETIDSAAYQDAKTSRRSISPMNTDDDFQSSSDRGSRNNSAYDPRFGSDDYSSDQSMFDLFFRQSKKDSNVQMLVDAVKGGMNTMVNVSSDVASGVVHTASAAASKIISNKKAKEDKNDLNSSTTSTENNNDESIERASSGTTTTTTNNNNNTRSVDDGKSSTKNENINVSIKRYHQMMSFQEESDEPRESLSGFVSRTRKAQVLDKQHVAAIYCLKFSPDGKFLASAGEDARIVIWSVGQKQYQAETDSDYAESGSGSRPTSDRFAESDFGNDERPESGNYSTTSYGSNSGTANNGRPSSGKHSSDGSTGDETSVSGSSSPTPMTGGIMSDSDDEDEDDVGEENNTHATGSDNNDDNASRGDSVNSSGDGESSYGKNKYALESMSYKRAESASGTPRDHVIDKDIIIFPTPCRIYGEHDKAHHGAILDLAWSRSNFLLSASSDQHVILWHVSQGEPLQHFIHNDIVTSIDFHPTHDRYFMSGCFDGKIRLWDIIEGDVADFFLTRSENGEETGKITCVRFTPDGSKVIAGFIGGKVMSLNIEWGIADLTNALKYQTEFSVKDRRGVYSDGRKVTGLQFVEADKGFLRDGLPPAEHAQKKLENYGVGYMSNSYMLLVTTNDNNVRLMDWEGDKTTYSKYKGGLNIEGLQIQASTSDDNRFVIVGTDDGSVVMWEIHHYDAPYCVNSCEPRPHNRNTYHAKFRNSQKDRKTGIAPATTVACFAPSASVRHVLESAEEMYRLVIPNEQMDGLSRFSKMSAGSSDEIMEALAPDDVLVPLSTDEEKESSSLLVATADLEGTIRIYVRSIE